MLLEETTLPAHAVRSMPSRPEFHLVEDRAAILRLNGILIEFAEGCDQPGAMQDMAYFLSKPGLLRRTPQLMLIFAGTKPPLDRITSESLLGAILLYNYRVSGCSIGVYTTNDRSGRNTLVAPPHLRSALAEFAARTLVERGAHVVMISFRDGDQSAVNTAGMAAPTSLSWKKAVRMARREREIAEYLPLESTYEATLATIGQRTRSNMRYYRRRAEKQIGCTFSPAVEMSRSEFLAFNRECTFAVPDRVAAWRYDIHKELSSPLFMGIHDKDGRWLSLVGARRFQASSEILWQMNRSGLPEYSLSLVMRAYFMEHEISQGSRRFYIEGGSSHPIRNSFVNERLVDFAVLRRSPTALLTRRLARHIVPGDNVLAHMLSDAELAWVPAPRSRRGERRRVQRGAVQS